MFLDNLLENDGTREVSFVSTTTALSYYVRKNRLKLKPRPGDIVFYNHSVKPFEHPHAGLVVSIDGWREARHFLAIEGETATGQPRGSQEPDGVFERHRYETDVIGFVTPRRVRKIEPQPVSEEPQNVRMSYFTSNPNTKARAVTAIQTALFHLTGQKNFAAGKLDTHTRSAFAKWDRERGIITTDGSPQPKSLHALGEASGVFKYEN